MSCCKSCSAWLLIISCCCLSASLFGEVYAQQGEVPADLPLQPARVITLKKMMADENEVTATSVKPGTTVIWLNDTRRVIEIEFVDKQVTLACGSPVGFFVNEEGSYISQKIIPRAVASMCFVLKGEYPYVLLLRTLRGADPLQGKTFRGKIIVE